MEPTSTKRSLPPSPYSSSKLRASFQIQEDIDDLTKDWDEYKDSMKNCKDSKAWALLKAESKLEAKEAELRLVEMEQVESQKRVVRLQAAVVAARDKVLEAKQVAAHPDPDGDGIAWP